MKKTQATPPPCVNRVTHDRISGRFETFAERGTGFFRIENNEIETGRNVVERTSITKDDPLSAESEISVHTRTGRVGAIVDVRVHSRLTADQANFFLETNLDVQENEHSLFARSWRHEIPREFI